MESLLPSFPECGGRGKDGYTWPCSGFQIRVQLLGLVLTLIARAVGVNQAYHLAEGGSMETAARLYLLGIK